MTTTTEGGGALSFPNITKLPFPHPKQISSPDLILMDPTRRYDIKPAVIPDWFSTHAIRSVL